MSGRTLRDYALDIGQSFFAGLRIELEEVTVRRPHITRPSLDLHHGSEPAPRPGLRLAAQNAPPAERRQPRIANCRAPMQ